jgi:GT2 family glycosyltransferase
MDLSIVIVNYNVKHFLKQCLNSIANSHGYHPEQIEVWVVDNASIDRSVEMLSEEFPWVKTIANTENVGFSKANNQAIRKAMGDYILLLNPDTILSEKTLSVCIEYLKKNDKVGALGVKMIDGGGNFLPESKRGLPTLWNSFFKLTGLSSIFPKSKLFNGYSLTFLDENKPAKVDVLCGAFMMMPKKVLDEVGHLDERFFMYGEDIDLSYRIIKAGYSIQYLPAPKIIHFKGESTKKGSFSYVKIFYEAMILYVKKHYSGPGSFLFVLALKMAIIFRAMISLLKRALKALLLPTIDLILILTLGIGIKHFWASYHFDNPDYYSNSPIHYNLVGAAIIFVLGMYLTGTYKKPASAKRSYSGLILGAVFAFAVYGLLNSEWRTSRAILLFLGVSVGFVIPFFHFALSRLQHTSNAKRIIIIGAYENGKRIQENISQLSRRNIEVIGVIHPERGVNTSEYINSIDYLNEVIRVMKVNELIFTQQDLSMEKIMSIMSSIESIIDFKIAGDDLLSFVGSRDKNANGEIYSVDITFNLSKESYLRQKKVLDILFCLIAITFSPISLVFKKEKSVILSNIMDVLVGGKTWVTYTQAAAYQLPTIKEGVIDLSKEKTKQELINYAKNYKVTYDILPFLNYLFH